MNNPYITNEEGIIRFDLCRLEKNKEKLCKCENPHYEIDVQNRLVTCMDCGAIVDPFEAIREICRHQEQYREYQREAIEKAKVYREVADKEWRRRLKNACFKDMERRYMDGLLPACPECGALFDPVKITSWSRPYKLLGQQEGEANE